MEGPKKLWKTDIVIWTDYNPTLKTVTELAKEGECGTAYIGRAHSELISDPCMDDDGPPEDFFGEYDGEDTN